MTGTEVSIAVDPKASLTEVTYPTAATWSCTASGLAEGPSIVTVVTKDEAGNTGSAKLDLTVDTIAPSVVITSPQPRPINIKTPPISYTASDGTILLKLDGAMVNKTSGDLLETLSDGSHTLVVEATDLAGNVGRASVTFTVDTAAPDATIAVKPEASSDRNSGSISFRSSDDSAIFDCKLDTASFTTCTSPYAYGNLPDGSHNFSVRAKDRAGNVTATPAAFSWTIDTVAPVTTASPAAGLYNSAKSVTLAVSETATVYYTSDGSQPKTTSAKYSAPIPVAVSTTLRFFAVDAAGNSETIKGATYIIDAKAPITTATPAAGTYSSAQSIILKANEAGSIYYTTNGTQPTTASAKYSAPISITDSCTLKFFAVDPAGNSEVVRTAAYTVTGRVTLTLTSAGTGRGTVTSTPSALVCNTGCSANFNVGTQVTLNAASSEYSIFKGWSGDCSGMPPCLLSMNANKVVGATFDQDTARSVRLNAGSISYYSSLLSAYLAAPASASIEAFGTEFLESPVFYQKKVVNIKGGYNQEYSSVTGMTQIKGKVVIRQGTVRVKRLAVH